MGSIPDHAPLSVSVENQLPQDLYDAMREFVRCHPHWDQYRLMQAALAGFLFQHGCQNRAVVRHYLDGLFRRQGQASPQATATDGSQVCDPTLRPSFEGRLNTSALPLSPIAGSPVAARLVGSTSIVAGCVPQCPQP